MKKLENLSFTEIYFGTKEPEKALLRGAKEKIGNTIDASLTHAPDEYHEELRGLASKVEVSDAQSQAAGRYENDDFIVTHLGARYRASRVTQSQYREDDKFYCLRKIKTESFEKLWKSSSRDIQKLAAATLGQRGMILFSGSFSSGKTRNASMLVDHWAEKAREMVVTLEDPPEYDLDRRTGDRGIIAQVDISGGHLNNNLRTLRRWAPRYVFFGEMRTPEMASAMLHMSISGPLCLGTIHASTPTQAVFSMIRFAAEAMEEQTALDIVSSSILGVVHHERIGDRFTTTTHDFSGPDSGLLKAKIRNGRPSVLQEELDRRVRASQRGRR